MNHQFNFRCGLLDFQVGECHDEIPFEPREYVRASAEAGIQEMVFTCKDAYGNAYYDSQLIKRNSAIKSDFLQEAIEAGKEFNVDIHAYFNVLLDDKIAGQFPEYRMVDSIGGKVIAYDYYKILCPNSPYFQIIRDRIADVVLRYDIQGVFMDITYFQPDTCFCEYCRREFTGKYGYPLSGKLKRGTREYRDWHEFRRKSRFNLLSSLLDEIHGVKDLNVVWNGSGSYLLGENEIDDRSGCLTSEFHAPDYLDGIIRAKWMHSRGRPFLMSVPYELGSWGDWTVNPEVTLDAVFSAVISNGGGVYVNHVPYPSGEFASSVNKSVLASIKNIFSRTREIEPWLTDARSVPDIAVIFSVETQRLFQWHSDESLLAGYHESLKGVVEMLMEGGRHFDILTEGAFQTRAREYKVVILADTACIENDTVATVREFAEGGGTVIATGFSSLFGSDGRRREDFALADVFGARFRGESEFSVDYIYDLHEEIGCGVPDNPILVQKSGSKTLKVSTMGEAEALASLVEPLFEATLDRHVYHQHAHPARRSRFPSIIFNRTGRGQCLYFAPRIFSSYRATGSPWLQKIFSNSLAHVCKEICVLVDDSRSVHVSLMQQGSRYVVHLVNVCDAKFDVSKSFMPRMIPVHNVKVALRVMAERVYTVPDMKPLEFSRNSSGIEFVVPEIEVHKVIVVEGPRSA
ncbi:MAG: hypothetical protein DRP71_04075 [Verrucomicrobia bacterium]|nr:MAG: hypothetical protein DRP71_04075 [Verrucomicrobiota bacterium]